MMMMMMIPTSRQASIVVIERETLSPFPRSLESGQSNRVSSEKPRKKRTSLPGSVHVQNVQLWGLSDVTRWLSYSQGFKPFIVWSSTLRHGRRLPGSATPQSVAAFGPR